MPAASDGDLAAFFVRKERKEHGLQRWIEGPEIGSDDRALVVEDTVTTGGSLIESIDRLKEEGIALELIRNRLRSIHQFRLVRVKSALHR